MIIEIILFISLGFLLLLYANKKPANLPPGTWGWPIIGIIPGGRSYYLSLLKNYTANYGGGLYCSNIGTRLVVFITDFELIRNALSLSEFGGRPDLFTVETFGDHLGVSMSQGKIWYTNRRFALKNLREFGMGKSLMEIYINQELNHLIEDFDKSLGKRRTIEWAISVAKFNLAWQLCASTRFPYDHEEIIHFCKLNVENFELLQSRITFLDFYPWANYFPKYIKDNWFNAKKFVRNKEDFKEYLMKYILDHRKTLNKENPRDLIDQYFIDEDETTDPELDFKHNIRNLVNILINFFTGSEVSSSTFRWFLSYMAMHPECQEKAQKQIDQFIPKDRLPTWDDRSKLPYIQACIHEAARLASVVIFSIPHATTQDVTFEGYSIPKGTVILPCVEFVHRDPKYWKNPSMFYPEHFLDAEGNFDTANTAFSAFSLGKRLCPGKSLSDMSLFMFAAAIFQRYTIRPADGVKISYASLQKSQFLNIPVNYEFVIEKRTN